MELVSSTVTAALVGVIIVLAKVIEWFMKRNMNGNEKVKQAKEYNGLGEILTKIDTRLEVVTTNLIEVRQTNIQLMEHLVSADGFHMRMVDRLDDVVSNIERITDSIGDLKDEIKNR